MDGITITGVVSTVFATAVGTGWAIFKYYNGKLEERNKAQDERIGAMVTESTCRERHAGYVDRVDKLDRKVDKVIDAANDAREKVVMIGTKLDVWMAKNGNKC